MKQMRAGQARTVLIEDHNFYIDQQGPAATRQVCLAIGDGLADRGAIDRRDDVFYVADEDIRGMRAGADFRPLVSARRSERERWMRILPPASIGAGAVLMPPALQRFFGPTVNEPMEAGAFRGVAAAPARSGASRARPHAGRDRPTCARRDLVTYATAPPWTPAFAIAGGIVTDVGGTLSRCAVVAREYGIPAVVGSRVATATIQDGQPITVDGTAGVVRLDE
jgi:pyruvate,water dikinase